MMKFWFCVSARFYHVGHLLGVSRSILSTRTCVETATALAFRSWRAWPCDVISTGRRGSVVSPRAASLSPALPRQSGSQQPGRFHPVVSSRRSRRTEMADDLGDEWWESQPAAAGSPGTRSPPRPQPAARVWQSRWSARRRGAQPREHQAPRGHGWESLSHVQREGHPRRQPEWSGAFPKLSFSFLSFLLFP